MSHLLVGIPAYNNSMRLATFKSLLSDCAKLLIGGWEIEIIDTISGAEIDTIRNKMVSYLASHEKATELVMVDDDVCWSPDDLLRLLAVKLNPDRDIVGGVYPKRADPIEYPFLPDLDDNGQMLVDVDSGCIECSHIPAGFMRVPKGSALHLIETHPELEYACVYNTVEPKDYRCYSLFEKMWEHSELTGEKHRSSEDVSFCKRVTKAGGLVLAHPDISMGHIGDKLFLGSKLRGNDARHSNEGA